ncbi:MAG: hypothetical protein EPO26_17895 [Chloroflexota bacterium]|nr:MAG: hypothetical protein EPO26_17895 [Chloroflexota bacterium]
MLPVYLSDLVLSETEANLARKVPKALPHFNRSRDVLRESLIEPPGELVRRAAAVVEPKDAPIVAGGIHAGVTHLATYDRRHLLSKRDLIRQHFGLDVATPDEILTAAGLRRVE